MFKPTAVLLFIWLTILALDAKGQDQEPPFKGVIKFYPLHLYRIFPGVSFAYEHRFAKRFSATLETGCVVDFNWRGSDFTNKGGIRLREELRYYFRYKYSKTRSTNAKGTYAGFDLHQNLVNYNDEFGKAQWREGGFGLKFGMAEYLGKISIDYSIGVSFRYANETPPDLWASLFNFWEERYPIIQPLLSLGVGYRIQ